MTFHIVLNKPTDLDAVTRGAQTGHNPRHSMAELARHLDATVHDGSGLTPDLIDRAVGKLTRTRPLWWTTARRLRRTVRPGDVVFCTGEDIGVPVSVLCGGRTARVAVMTHFADRPKARAAFRLFGLKRRVALFLTVSRFQAAVLERFVGGDPRRVRFIEDQTDLGFFRPGPAAAGKERLLVASVGLEQRDYATLAAATADLDIDVRISGFSADTRVLARSFPADMPANMDRRFYPWPDLVQLYRDADLVAISVFDNSGASGLSTVMEALGCGRPVVVTATAGLEGYLDRPDAIRAVPPGDPAALRAAITDLLGRPAERARMAEAAGALARERHRLERYVAELGSVLRRLHAPR